MNLLIKFPTRARPIKFKQTLNLYRSMLSGKHQVSFLVSCDADDATMKNPRMVSYLKNIPNLKYTFGNSKSKISAINADMEGVNFDIVLLASDDMLPQKHGYDDVICSNMEQHFPDLDGVLHFNDGRAGANLNTLCILGKKYYDRFGYIYHPQYVSLWCDNEFDEVSQQLGKKIYIDDVIIKHAWADYTGKDWLHKRNESYFKTDKATFEKRKAAGFPKEFVE